MTPISALSQGARGAGFLRRGSVTRKSLPLRARASRNFLHHHFVAEKARIVAARAARQGLDLSRAGFTRGQAAAIERQAHADAGALIELAFDRDRAAVQTDEAAHDRKPKAGALVRSVVGRAGLEEGAAKIDKVVRRNADPGIGDADDDVIAVGAQLDRDTAAARREFDRV